VVRPSKHNGRRVGSAYVNRMPASSRHARPKQILGWLPSPRVARASQVELTCKLESCFVMHSDGPRNTLFLAHDVVWNCLSTPASYGNVALSNDKHGMGRLSVIACRRFGSCDGPLRPSEGYALLSLMGCACRISQFVCHIRLLCRSALLWQ